MKIQTALLALLLGLSPLAFALQIPEPSDSDPRVGYVNYDPDEIVQITGVVGYQTTVLFSPDEQIEDLGAGFTNAWEIGALKNANGFFIKPKVENPNTNIGIVTNKRTYTFDMVMKGDAEQLKEDKKKKRNSSALPKYGERFFYMIKFRYPEDARKKQELTASTEGMEKKLETAGRKKLKNQEYWIQGPRELQPIAAWDDGRFTYLKFGPNTGFPTIFVPDAAGQESIVQQHVADDTIVIHRVVKKIILRRDGKAAAVTNEAFDSHGIENPTKTISNQVRRIVKDGTEDQQTVPDPAPKKKAGQ